MADIDPLSFAALAASGPMWEKEKPPTDWRRCAHCQHVKRRSAFSNGATVCQKCVAENKLRRSKEAKTRYAAKKRQEMRERAGRGAPPTEELL